MKSHIILVLFLLISGCHLNKKEAVKETESSAFYVGTYTGNGSEGIYKCQLKDDGGLELVGLAVKTDNPSFLTHTTDEKYIIAVSEINSKGGESAVKSFRISGDSLIAISEEHSGGAHPCFVAVNEAGYVLVANYTGGNVGLLKINKKGELSELLDSEQHTGRGTTSRQEAPHAHSSWFSPWENEIISVDLGTNELWFSSIDKTKNILVPSDPQKLQMAPGAGPRHLAFHPDNHLIYVINELNSSVSLLKKNKDGAYVIMENFSTLPADYAEFNTCADIHISSDGRFLYASNRGHNSIAIFEVEKESGALTALGHEETRGNTPRNFSLSPDQSFLVVANQNSNSIVSFRRDTTNGLLTFISQIEVPSPVCIAF